MENQIDKSDSAFHAVIRLIQTLRGENGCPWDKKQTPGSMVRYLIEEAYELLDAVQSGSHQDICEEIGDVLFLVLFVAVMFQEKGVFRLEDLIQTNLEKMTRRHPHVFGNATADTPDDVKRRWIQIKSEENKGRAASSVLDSVPQTLPALMRCYRISERAARTGFDWQDVSGVMQTAEEEWQEFKEELRRLGEQGDAEACSMEFGDVLFTLVNVGRLANIHPEEALTSATKKFETRFKAMERLSEQEGRPIESLSFEEMHLLWDQVKKDAQT